KTVTAKTLAMRFRDSLEPNLLRTMSSIESQQPVEAIVLQAPGDLNLAVALTLSENMNRAAGHGTCHRNMLGTAALIDLQDSGCPGSINLQFQLGSHEIALSLFQVNV